VRPASQPFQVGEPMIDRRRLIALCGGAATAIASRATAQDEVKPVIGILSAFGPDGFRKSLDSFHDGLRKEGFIAGMDVLIDHRWVDGRYGLYHDFVNSLIRRRVRVILTTSLAATEVARNITTIVPVVFVLPNDPVDAGLVTNLARPESNITGVTYLSSQFIEKRIQLMSELTQSKKLIGFLVDPRSSLSRSEIRDINLISKEQNYEIITQFASSDADLQNALVNFQAASVSGIIFSADAYFRAFADHVGSYPAALK